MMHLRTSAATGVIPARSAPRPVRRLKAPEDAVDSAKQAGLRYVVDTAPGIRRVKLGKDFRYIDPGGRPVQDADTLRRIRALAIPPAWTEVWICPSSSGHVQATGRDAKGRKQYRYHEQWRAVRDETKYGRMIAFGLALPRIRAATARDLARPGLPRRKMLATIVRLLGATLIRVGNEEYARDNGSFGLTTMRDRHVRVVGPQIRFQFRGKSGKTHAITLEDRRLAAIVKRSRDLPGYELFQYVDERGVRRTIESADVNAYLREIAGEPFTAKDFRTWAGTVLAARALQEARRADSKAAAKRHVLNAIESVAARLGNTKAICRKCYIHPAIIEGYLDGSLLSQLQRRVGKELRSRRESLPPDEAAVLRFLQRGLKRRRRSTDNRDHASVSTLLRRSLKQVRSKEGGVGRRVRSKG